MMFLKEIKLTNFRNYENLSLVFHPGINIIYGQNAQGKTNLLESIYVLGLTKSHRSFIDHNLIKENKDFARIEGKLTIDHFDTKMELLLETKKKKLKIDSDVVGKVSDYVSKMNIIIFYPEDLDLLKGAPGIRRRYLNMELCQLYSNYLNLLNDYNKLLKIRNELLKKRMKEEVVDSNYFHIVTTYFIDKGVSIYRMRKKFIDRLNAISPEIYETITGMKGFHLEYRPCFEITSFEKEFLKQQFIEKLQNMEKVELKLGTTMVGPHRDDFEFYLADRNLKVYGSQGQQRVAILALKLAEIDIFTDCRGTTPILLLDDVFSELDDKKKNNLLKYIDQNIQTIITTTDLDSIDESLKKQSKLIEIDHAEIMQIEEVE